ncbi:MAG: hypothetical protein AAGF87_11375 [Bacteroidota bacterium]
MYGGQIGGGNQSGGGSALRGLLSLVAFGVIVYFAVFAFAFIYRWLWYAVPFFLIGTALVDYKLLLGLASRLGRLTSRNLIGGVLAGAFVLFSMPFLAPVLLLIALFTRTLKKRAKTQSAETEAMFDLFQQRYRARDPQEIEIDYEEISSEPGNK